MSDVEKVRRGLALVIGGIVVFLLGALVGPSLPSDLSQITAALVFGGVAAVGIGVVWLVTGLWHGDKAQTD